MNRVCEFVQVTIRFPTTRSSGWTRAAARNALIETVGLCRAIRLPSPGVAGFPGFESVDESRHTPELILGIDEAGRGSLVGPLVVGGFLVRSHRIVELRELGVRDSKLLTREKRERLYPALARIGRRVTVVIHPAEIDSYVRHGRLNHLEAKAFAEVVRRTSPDRVVADACDVNARRFGARIAQLSRSKATIVAQHKADRTDVVVGAASIVAKVCRDRLVDKISTDSGEVFGSGYPSDPKTIRYVEERLTLGSAPEFIRRTWATIGRLKLRPAAHSLDTFPR